MKTDFIVIAYGSDQRFYNDIENMGHFVKHINRRLRKYTREWLVTTEFYNKNKAILDSSKGGGWWSWKPFIILDALKEYERVLYMDANTIFAKQNIDKVAGLVNSIDVLGCIKTGFLNKDYTTEQCYQVMNCLTPEYKLECQVWAGVVIATRKAIPILNEWLKYVCIHDAVCPDKDDVNNHRHRNDQSILTNLIIKYKIPTLVNENIFYDNANYRNHPITLKRL
jgi:hypothetical protein